MEEYKRELFEELVIWSDGNPTLAREWIKNSTGDDCDEHSKLSEYGVADKLTGNDNGGFYRSNVSMAKSMILGRNVLEDTEFLGYLHGCETHLEDLLAKGWDTLDIWYRCYVMDNHLTSEDIIKALKRGVSFNHE